MEQVVVPIVTFIGGLVSGVAVALAKSWGENWRATQTERRARRAADLDGLLDLISSEKSDPMRAKGLAYSIGDPALIESIGRMTVRPTEDERSEARGNAATQIADLRKAL